MEVRPKKDSAELWYGAIYKAHIRLYHSQKWTVVRWKSHQYVTLRRSNITIDVTREDYLRLFRGNKGMRISFRDLQKNCRHQGWTKKGEIRMCSYKDRIPAKCWDDWQECKEQNCPLRIPKAAAGIKGQLYLDDIIGRA